MQPNPPWLSRGPREEAEHAVPAWTVTFADLALLLLTFFVLLLSFANLDAQKFRDMLGSVKDAFGVQKQTVGDASARAAGAIDLSAHQGAGWRLDPAPGEAGHSPPMDQALTIIRARFEGLGGGTEVLAGDEEVTVRLAGKLLFLAGSAELRPEAAEIMARVGDVLRQYVFDLYILGHTDAVPFETAQFPSNWELSSARAAAALRHLVAEGADPRRLVALGLADTRPIEPNTSPEGRARNRRVEFLFKSPRALAAGGFRAAGP
ncbi:MAG: flagellar motor protein MotB [Deferrisomatales bacterium]